MSIRRAVEDLVNAGSFPSEEATVEEIEKTQRLLELITAPVSDEEAQMLLATFGPDDCFGMACVQVGDLVTATNPATGTTTAEPVTAQHVNQDTDLADVTVRDSSGAIALLHTT
jgi:hypothetical protein